MPNRILREGILTSPRIAKLDWAEEVFYRRLHSVVDDFGRYYGDPGLLRAACYPRQLRKVSEANIVAWVAAAVKAKLVMVYEIGGEKYVLLLDFRQQVRAKESKFPQPPSECVADAQQKISNAHLDVSVVVDVSEDGDVGGGDPSRETSRSGGNGIGIVYIPLNDGTEHPVKQEDLDELGRLYPALDVLQTLREIRGWNIANSSRRKTKGGVMRHVHAWFAKEQNKAP